MFSTSKKHPLLRSKLQLAVLAALLNPATSTTVFAQDKEEKDVEVIRVTGSYVTRDAQASMSSPIQIVGSEEILKSGFSGVDDIIVNNTANTGSVGGVNNLAGGGSESRQTRSANLRGLGPSSTLV